MSVVEDSGDNSSNSNAQSNFGIKDGDSSKTRDSGRFTIAICSGGTGGHMFPAGALFDSLKARGYSVTMITDARGDRFCDNIESAEKIVLPTLRFSLKFPFKLCRDFCKVLLQLKSIWPSISPDLIVGFGSSFTIAPILIGKLFKSRVLLYEQNSVLGRANKFLAHFSDYKVSTFVIDEKWKQLPSPVRKEFVEVARISDGYKYKGRIKIVVIGGSQGASSFARIIPATLELIDKELRSEIDIVQQVSTEQMNELKEAYNKVGVNAKLLDFVHDVAEEMTGAQLIISRSGASTLAELTIIGRPAILIPYPLAADDHQYYNALCYKNRKAAWVVEEGEDTEKKLASIIISLSKNRQLLKDAATNMINGNNGSKRNPTEVFSDYVDEILSE